MSKQIKISEVPATKFVYGGSNKVKCSAGDILKNLDPEDPWQYFICFAEDEYSDPEIRDLNANNVGMDQMAEVENIGHFLSHLEIFDEDDLSYYFGLDIGSLRYNNCKVEGND